MPGSFSKKLVDFTLAIQERAAAFLARLTPAWVGRLPKRPARLCLELFVAVSLSVNFYYLVRTQCLPKPRMGNQLSIITFCWLAENFNLPATSLPRFWWTRVAAPALSSRLTQTTFDYPIDFHSPKCKNVLEVSKSAEFQNLFGLYHAGWLFLTFALLIALRADALLIILGVFAGLMYNLIEPAGNYYYPWDMPVMFFFTLACLLFERGRIWPLLPVVCLGGLIKETTLCCALFILLGAHWNWVKRIAGFVAVVAGTFAINRLLMKCYGVQAPLFAMNNAETVTDLYRNTLLPGNLLHLFSLELNHVLFANAGALFLMMLVPWRNRRDVLFKLIIVVFAAGQFLYGYIDEFRVWYELLPLGWILLSEAIARLDLPLEESAPDHRLWTGTYWLATGTLAAVLLALFVASKATMPPVPANLKSDDEVLREIIAAAEAGDVIKQYELGQTYQNRQNTEEAVRWYRRAADAGNVSAQFELGLIYFGIQHDYVAAEKVFRQAADRGHAASQYYMGIIYGNGMAGQRDYQAGMDWLLKASYQGEEHAQFALGRFYQTPNCPTPDLLEAYKWLKIAELQGANLATKELAACAAKMSPEQIAEAEARFKQINFIKQ